MKNETEIGISLDNILMTKAFYSRGEIKKYIQAGAIFIDGVRASSGSVIISSPCVIQIGKTKTINWNGLNDPTTNERLEQSLQRENRLSFWLHEIIRFWENGDDIKGHQFSLREAKRALKKSDESHAAKQESSNNTHHSDNLE